MDHYQSDLLDTKPTGIFYGYWIVAVSFFGVFIFSGCGVGAFSLFVKPLQAEFNWGRGKIMLGFSVFYLLTGLAAPFIGGLVDRYGARGVVATGSALTGLGLALLGLIGHILHYYAAYTLIGISMAAIGQVPASAVVSNWFVRRRGTAIGIMSTGIGVGILFITPIVGAYVMPVFGWRSSYLVLAILAWMLLPLALFVLRTKPSDMGLWPDGAMAPKRQTKYQAGAAPAPSNSSGLGLKSALRTSTFWLLAVTFFINGHSALGVIQNQVPHLQDIEFPLEKAAIALTIIGLGSAIGKFAFGWLCDRIHARYACAISFGMLATGTIILMGVKPASPVSAVWLYSIFLGLGAGGWFPTMSILTNIYFGRKSYGAIFGMISLVQGAGGAIGPWFAGYMFDVMGTYHFAFLVFLTTFGVAIAAVLMTRQPRVKP